ncbi:MAG TPA: biotin transporter BioY [Ruminococcus sp.]|nr:biotin transporter BioY [Ruminococcus sp.]
MKNNEKPQKFRTVDLAYIAIGAALIAVCAWISIPLTVPFTFQTFGVFFVLSALGGKRGTCSILVYILLGAVGIPVFSGFASGIGVLLGNTGGYILGFLLSGLLYTGITRLFGNKLLPEIIALLLGLVLCYAFGTAWFMFVYTRANGAVGLGTVLSWCVLPFVLPDLIKLALARTIAGRIRPLLDKSTAF